MTQDAQTVSSDNLSSLMHADTLPDDPATLKQLIIALLTRLSKETKRREEVERHIHELLKKIMSKKSIASSIDQLTLFDIHVDAEAILPTPPPPEDPPKPPRRKCRPHGRRRPEADMEEREVIHDVLPEIKELMAGVPCESLPDVVTYQYDYQPGKIIKIRHVQKKYVIAADPNSEVIKLLCDDGAAAATPGAGVEESSSPDAAHEDAADLGDPAATPATVRRIVVARKQIVLPSCLAAPGLLALIWLNKFGDHLPLYRQENITKRYGLHLARSTLCEWMIQLSGVLEPIYRRMIDIVLSSRVIHTDDTTTRLQNPQTGKRSTARFWNYVGDEEHLLTVFDFTLTHERTHPATFLANYCGYLQADAYNGYDGIYLESQGNIIEVGCWYHARKRFKAAVPSDIRAEVALAFIKRIYKIEEQIREHKSTAWSELSVDERAANVTEVRQRDTVPLLKDFGIWLRATYGDVLPKSELAEAIRYTLNQWNALQRFVEFGLLDPDNNEAERGHRGIAIGRKNWIMVGSERGGRAAAIHFSIISSCKQHNIDPFAYLVDVLGRLPRTPATELDSLLPHLWRPPVAN